MAFAFRLRALVFLSCGSFPFVCQAQSFDCTKAQSVVEKAICASPALIAQDAALADAYRKAVAVMSDDQAKLDDLRQAQRRWLAERNNTCVDTNAANLTQCLITSYQARLAVLKRGAAPADPARDTPSQAAETSVQTAGDKPAAPAPAASPAADCSKAKTAIEKAICASPALTAQDADLASSYREAVAALKGDEAKLSDLRAAQRRWLAERNNTCVDADPTRLAACLAESYQARRAVLKRARGPLQQAPAASAPAVAAPAVPAPAVVAPTPQATEPFDEVAQDEPTPGEAPAAQPAATTGPARPVPQPLLSVEQVPADQDSSTLLTVAMPGHIAMRAQSASGVAIQLIDMISGPAERMGVAGTTDGRIDALLDKGTYKIRIFGAKGATGQAKINAQAFQELEQPGMVLTAQTPLHGNLSDLQQRSYWVDVAASNAGAASGQVDMEAVGRSLQDLRLWRNGTDLVDLAPRMSVYELRQGIPMNRARLNGTVQPGRYLVTAYGGKKLVWTVSDEAEPFHIRTGTQRSLAGGIVEGAIGAFGSIRFEAPGDLDTFRLELPQPAPVSIRAGPLTGSSSGFEIAAISKTSREPVAKLSLSADNQPKLVEVSGYEGQPFRVRALTNTDRARFDGSVPNLISLDVAGEGGDEIPATAILLRRDLSGKTTAVEDDAPEINNSQAWHRRFNLRGPTSLLFKVTQAGQYSVRTTGVGLRSDISAMFAPNAPRADGLSADRFTLDPGYYLLRLLPEANAAGIVDVLLGPTGVDASLQAASPARTVISFGVQKAEAGSTYAVFTNTAPGLLTGPRAVAVPVDLEARPLALWQDADPSAQPAPAAGQPSGKVPAPVPQAPVKPSNDADALSRPPSPGDLRIDIHAPLGGAITAVDKRGAPIRFATESEQLDPRGRSLTLRFPATASARSILVSWQPDPAAAGRMARPVPVTPLVPGQKNFLDLAQDAQKTYRLDVAEGGLYRIETLGRLQTSLALGTSFLPSLDTASDNGDGHNALLQTYLRAGSYQINVSAQNSSGHLGLVATPAALATVPVLVPDGTSRGVLAPGRGAVVPIDIASDGTYQLDLYALGGDLTARLEDADGWPLTAPGPVSDLREDFKPGHYRLVIMPRGVDTRFVARLRPVIDPPQLEGHGPHRLPFNATQAFQWREPQGKNDQRVPDSWTFDLLADADVSIALSEGMVATLVRDDKEQMARFVSEPEYSGELKAGHYRVDLVSQSHDDRLDYQITLKTKELQPGEARFVGLPSTLSFNVDKDSVISLGTFGRSELKAVLKDGEGHVVERLSGRSDDWNIALSSRLAAGSYTLDLDYAAASGKSGEAADNTGSDDASAEDDTGHSSPDEADTADIEVQLALPREQPQPALAATGAAVVEGTGIFTFALPAAVADHLALVAATSTSDLVLSLEKRGADGEWKPQASSRGRTPVLAWPAQAGQTEWRASAWTVDRGKAPIKIATRSIAREAREPGKVALEPFAIEGLDLSVNVALVHAPSAGLVNLGDASDLLVGASPDRPLGDALPGLFAPQSDRLWLMSRTANSLQVDQAQPDREIALTLPADDHAIIPAMPVPSGKARFWRADSAFGQPGLAAGRGMGVGVNSAVAIAGSADLKIWNAGSDTSLQMRLKPIDVSRLEPTDLKGTLTTTVPALSALPISLPTGTKRLGLELAPGMAAVSGPSAADLVNVWSGTEPLSRNLSTAAEELWLVNLTDKAGSARLSLSPGQGGSFTVNQIRRRFFGTAGSEEIAVDAIGGDHLDVSGGAATFVGDDGSVLRGDNIRLPGPGRLILDHGAGLVALWLERAGNSPWPKPAPQMMNLPESLALEGQAMAFALDPDQPMVLNVSSDAPVIVALEQDGRREFALFPMGAEFHRYLGVGKAILTFYATHEGPLSGNVEVTSTPVIPVGEGTGAPVVLSPGTSALFGFEVKTGGNIGVGLRSDPDLATARLLDAKGQVLGEGINQLKRLDPGSYLLEGRAPADRGTLVVRPSVLGLSPPPAGPPPDLVNDYLQRAGLKQTGAK